MKDKTPIYMLAIVIIVAVVGFFLMISAQSKNNNIQQDSLITGNAIYETSAETSEINFGTLGKIFFVLMLGFMAVYLYKSK